MSASSHRRNLSDVSLEQLRGGDDDIRSGSPQLRTRGRKAFVIPGMECDGSNPLKSLQRLKEADKLATLPRSTPDLQAVEEEDGSVSPRVSIDRDSGTVVRNHHPMFDKPAGLGSAEHLGPERDTKDMMPRSHTNEYVSDTAQIPQSDINYNCVNAGQSSGNAASSVVPERKHSVSEKVKPALSPRHSSLIPSSFRLSLDSQCDNDYENVWRPKTVEFDGDGSVIVTPKGNIITVSPVTSPTRTKGSPTKRPKEPPPIPPIPKPKPKIIAKLVRNDPELRASQEKLTEKRQIACDMGDTESGASSLNSSIKDLHMPSRNTSQYSSFKDVTVSPSHSPAGSSSNSTAGSLRDVSHRLSDKTESEQEDIYIQIKSPKHNPTQEEPGVDEVDSADQDGITRGGSERDSLTKNNRLSKSADELDRAAKALLDLTGPYLTPKSRLPSSVLADLTDKSLSMGDVPDALTPPEDEEELYSLPQPQCFGDMTLKAVKNITEKYDTLQRRKLRAMSFREQGRYSHEPASPESDHSTCLDDVFTVSGDKATGTLQYGCGVTGKDVARMDLFYRSYGTEVHVGRCLVDITFHNMSPNTNDMKDAEWEPVHNTGIPVFLLNTGKGKRKRSLTIALAERETGFTLWQDTINYLSNYRELTSTVHVMQVSTNLRRVVGLHFYSRELASDFMDHFRTITKDPNDELWKIGNQAKSTKKRWPLRRSKSKKKKVPTATLR